MDVATERGFPSVDASRLQSSNVRGALVEQLRRQITRGRAHAEGTVRGSWTRPTLSVDASGEIPDVVTLKFDGARDLELPSAGAGLFRTLLRSLQEEVNFHAVGGDDEDVGP